MWHSFYSNFRWKEPCSWILRPNPILDALLRKFRTCRVNMNKIRGRTHIVQIFFWIMENKSGSVCLLRDLSECLIESFSLRFIYKSCQFQGSTQVDKIFLFVLFVFIATFFFLLKQFFFWVMISLSVLHSLHSAIRKPSRVIKTLS